MRAIKLVIWIRNMIQFVQRLQHALVERNSVSHHRQTAHFVFHFVPNLGKQRRMIGVLIRNAVHLGGPKIISVGHRLDQTIVTLCNFIVSHDDNAHATRTRHLAIGTFKVDGGKIMQMVFGYVGRPFGIRPICTCYFLFISVIIHCACKITEFVQHFRKIMLPLPRKVGLSPTLLNHRIL